MGKFFLTALATAALGVSACAVVADETTPIGKRINDFSARDYRGKQVALADFAEDKIVVVAFMGTECPQAKLYASRLVALADEFADRGVALIVVDSNQQDSMTELGHFARTHKMEFPVLKDTGNVIADQMGAIRTPEVFLLDEDRVVRYWGRIDDQYGFQKAGVAYKLEEPRRRDLAVAIEETLAGKPVTVAVAKSQGCHIGRVKEPVADSEVTYSEHIAKVFNNNCVYCHREGQIAPFPMTNYEESVGWAEMIREVVNERRMPPWHADPDVGHFSNDARLSDKEIALINTWVDNGAPEGDSKHLPEPPKFADGWLIPEPDEVIQMADKPYEVPATGVVEYQRFIVDPKWTEDKWIKAMECKPGNSAVVHHIIVYLVPSGVTPTGQAGRLRTNWLGAFAPGVRPQVLPDDMARFVQKGSKLMFEMHYTPTGTVQEDLSCVAFKFADPEKVEKEVAVQNAGNFTFKIPPGDPNYQVESEYVFRHKSLLLSVSPHMHVRGKDFRYDLVFPDGKRETVLWVPGYDFGWQTTYMLDKPREVPRGTKLHCVAHFDNSADNYANPDPTKEVTWGEQTWEEMMFGWFEMSLADQDLTQPAGETARVKEFLEVADTLAIDDQLTTLLPRSLQDEKTFELIAFQLFDLVPQLDRICVTAVEKGRLRLKFIQQRHGLQSSFKSKSTRVRAEGQSLADYAVGDEVVVNQSLADTKGSVMLQMARKDIRSSMHVPIELKGARATINFWSAEQAAFPSEAVKLLEQVARLMDASSTAVATK